MTIKKVLSFSIYKRLLTGVAALAFALQPFAGVKTVSALAGAGTFDAFSTGSVNGQSGWESTGGYDQAVVPNTYGYTSFGSQALRLSNAVTSGAFGNQTFSYSTANEAGETGATNGGKSGGTRQNHYEAQFDIASALTSQQNGLSISVSPDRGDGSRMSYLRFDDAAAGIDVYFDDVQGTGSPANFVETKIATLSRTALHTVKFVIDYADGPSNDVVQVYLDGVLKHTGTTWENYYRYDAESAAEQTTRTSDSLIFRAGGTAASATSGAGYLFDNVSVETSTVLPDTTGPTVTITSPTANYVSGTTTISGTTDADTDHYYLVVKDSANHIVYGPGTVTGATVNDLAWDTTAFADGTYTIDLEARDTNGNKDASSVATKQVTVDNTSPSVPTNGTPNNSYKTTNNFDFNWDDSTDANPGVKYEFQSSLNSAQTGNVLTNGLWDSGVLPTSMIHSSGAANGTWYWQVRAIDAAGNKSAWSPIWNMTIDSVVPSTPVITSPTNNAYSTTTPILNKWDAATDTSGIAKYQVLYVYDDGHTFSGSTCPDQTTGACRDTTTTSRNHVPAANEQGGVTIRVRAIDNAGNVGAWSNPVHYIYDSVAPNVSLTSPANNATVPGTSLTQHWASTSTDVDHYVYESFNNAAATSLRWSENMGTHTSKAANNVANATFWWRVTAYDHAGNATVSPLWKLTVSNPVPSVSAQDFSTWDNSANGFMGITAGFGLNDFSHVNNITITLANADGDIVTNTADPDFISLINANGWTQFSAPFVVSGTLDDTFCNGGPCWVAGAHTWTATDKPTKVTATVVGKNNLGQTVTKTATNTTLAESPSYESLLPTAPVNTTNVLGDSTSTPGMGGSLPIATFAAVVNPDSAVELVGDDATNTDDRTTDQTPAKTLGAATNAPGDNNSDSDAATTATGLAWYWWAIIIAAVAGAAWWLFAARRRSSES